MTAPILTFPLRGKGYFLPSDRKLVQEVLPPQGGARGGQL